MTQRRFARDESELRRRRRRDPLLQSANASTARSAHLCTGLRRMACRSFCILSVCESRQSSQLHTDIAGRRAELLLHDAFFVLSCVESAA